MKTPPARRSFGSVGSAGGSALANAAANGSGHKKTSSTDATANGSTRGVTGTAAAAPDSGPATPRSGLGGIGAGVFSALMSGVNPFASASKTSEKEKAASESSPSSSNASPATPTPASTAAAVAASEGAPRTTQQAQATPQTQTPHVPTAILVPPPSAQGPGATTPTTAKRVSFPPQSTPPPRTPVTPTTPMSSGSAHSNNSTSTSNPSALHALSGLDDDGAPRPSSSRPAPQSPALSRRTSMARSERRMSAQLAGADGHSPGHGGGHSQRNSLQLARSPSRGSSQHGHGSGGGSKRTSRVLAGARHRLSQSVSAADVEQEGEAAFVDAPEEASLHAVDTASTPASSSADADTGTSKRAPITVRDFAFPPADVRHSGLGPDVPPPCDPARLARRLRGDVRMSDYGAPEDPDDDDDDGLNGWGASGFAFGKGRMSFGGSSTGSGGGDGVSAADFARNFGDDEFGEDEEEDSDEDDGGLLYTDRPTDEDEDELYYAESYADVAPGLYRAQFAFAAIDRAEMDLVEGQLIYVLGSGGDGTDGSGGEEANAGAGWAVARDREPPLVMKEADVLEVNALVGARTDAGSVWGELWAAAAEAAEAAGGVSTPAPAANPPPLAERRALVPDSYIVLIRGEGEREEDAHARLVRYLEWVEKERVRQLEEAAESAAAGKGGEGEEDEEEEGVFEDAQAGDERGQLQA
ncbi:hypothetical protein B0H16DRAFT_124257 [Mycena metata]|uniref:SH3 domain-containing protein n=1 Tax=Mycena metata TaxID=1033252 RepID=A0AAD7I6H8_9AGAR|nr:hypothetical protein B0H16DRAFT_124257 [Mycena metata]